MVDDTLIFGKRVRHHRTRRGLTLKALGDLVGTQAPYLSMVENGKREPKLGLVRRLAEALDVAVADLLSAEPPDRRSALEIEVERIQTETAYDELGLPHLKPSATVPDLVLEHLVTLYRELRRTTAAVTPAVERARRANAELRDEMRRRHNYFDEIEEIAAAALDAVGYPGVGGIPQGMLTDLAGHFGYTIHPVQDVPHTTRSITDIEHRRIYIPQRDELRTRAARSVTLQTLGHFALGHGDPAHFGEFLRQRVEANYFAGAVLLPAEAAVPSMGRAKEQRDLSVEDLKELFYVSYEMAAHRFTNLATRFLGIATHFVRSDETGSIWKAYENNGVPFPTAADGGVEGERLCREWGTRQVFHSADKFSIHYQYTDTSAGTFWCATHVEADREPHHAITVGARFEDAGSFRGWDTDRHSVSGCPDGPCCRLPDDALEARWAGRAWPSPSAHSHVPAALPAGTFPGVELADVYEFLERHSAPA